MSIDQKMNTLGIKIPEILIPKKEIDLTKWAVIACDQFTSEENYWKQTKEITKNSPSTLSMIFPECYLEEANPEKRIKEIHLSMEKAFKEKIFRDPIHGFILIDRKTNYVSSRKGLVLAVDLERYDFSKQSTSLIRATEGTIVERLPPRMKIRRGAPIELPHIMLLINDPKKTVIEPLFKEESKEMIYDFPLMQKGGAIKGWKITDEKSLEKIAESLEKLIEPQDFKSQYNSENPLLFAAGDGNHSLATAKAMWEEFKKENKNSKDLMEHPSRFALIEVVNLYDDGLLFEPIHRLMINTDETNFLEALKAEFSCELEIYNNLSDLEKAVAEPSKNHLFGIITKKGYQLLTIKSPLSKIETGTIQSFIDNYLLLHKDSSVDYIHGTDSTLKLGQKERNIGLLLPPVDKDNFFNAVINEGALPRKTFSMGEATEKRYYMESRKIL